ncbi:MFS transporter [Chitinimonas lacunae]|uniref:MFS transporter n=1 Tax=Chitinimonas lacunae TaxID=1963018 RepID=A0ABV8MKV6_9NEIS
MLTPLLPIPPRRALYFCLLLALFELLTYIASDVVMPAMLNVTRDLAAGPQHIPYALNAYLLGGVALQWLIGPLSDRFGRRPMLLIGCAGFTVTCIASYWVDNIHLFNGLRLLQGIGLGFVVVVSYPALQEAFAETDAVRLMAMLANIALLSPLLGPLLGSVLLEWISWRTLFLLIGICGALTWVSLYCYMPETLGVTRRDGSRLDKQPLALASVAASYRSLLRNRRFLAGSAALGLIGLPLIAWIGLAPLLLVKGAGLSTMTYGLWQLPVFGGLITGNLLLNHLAERYSLESLAGRSLWALLGGLLLGAAATWLWPSVPALVAGLTLYTVGLGICNATLYRLTLFSSDASKGVVSAMLGMISVAILGLGGSVLAACGAGNGLTDFAIAACATGLLALWPLRHILRPQSAQAQYA